MLTGALLALAGCPADGELPPPPIATTAPPGTGTGDDTGDEVPTGGGGVQNCLDMSDSTGTGGTADGTDETGDTPCVEDEDCGPCAICVGEVCVGTGQLRFTLTWTTDSDFDLHVITPDGVEIFFANPSDGGGVLDVDQCIGPCGNGTHVENIFFADMPPCGQFTTYVVNFDGRAGGDFEIEVDGVAVGQFMGTVDTVAGSTSTMFTFETCT